MVKIEAIIRPAKLDEVKAGLKKYGITGITVSQIVGCGSQQGHTEVYRGNEFTINLIPKIRLEIVVKDEAEDEVINIIAKNAYTGEIGDGKIFVYPIKNVIRIRTNEKGEQAL